jgi:drug/metabolite transporter (DMT)-like permease
MSLIGLWLSNGMVCAIVVFNAFCWGRIKKSLGQFQLNFPFLIKLAFNKFFIGILALGVFNAFVTYYAQAILGVASGQFFYYFGTPVIMVASYFYLGERYDRAHVVGIALILIGAILIS